MIDCDAVPAAAAGLGPAAETALIPLWARACESRRPDALLRDPVAERAAARLEPLLRPFGRAWKSQIGVIVRSARMDSIALRHLADHPNATVLNLGAGLDTRPFRLHDAGARWGTWIDADLPDALAARRDLIPEVPSGQTIATELHDPAAGRTLADRLPASGQPVLVLAEGVLMFLAAIAVDRLLGGLGAACPEGRIAFDAIGGLMIAVPWLHDSLGRTRCRFRWGGSTPAGRRIIDRHLADTRIHPFLHDAPGRWRWMRHLQHAPPMRRQFVLIEGRFPS